MSGDRYVIRNHRAIHFITIKVVGWVSLFIRPEYKETIVESLNYCIKNKGLRVHGWVLMSNHVHLLISGKPRVSLSNVIRDFKAFTSKQLVQQILEIPESRREWLLSRFNYEAHRIHGKKDYKWKLWSAGYYGLECDNIAILAEEKLDYIHHNPVKQLIVTESHEYLFSSARDYAGIKGMVEIDFL